MKIAAVALLALLPSIAHAEDEPDTRDPDNALALSIVGTVAGAVAVIPTLDMTNSEWKKSVPLFALSQVLPSAGQFYAGNYLSPGLVTRLVGGSLIVIGMKDPFESDQIISAEGRGLFLLGFVAVVGGTVYDIATARRSAERYNARQVRVTPAIATDQGLTPGFALAGQF